MVYHLSSAMEVLLLKSLYKGIGFHFLSWEAMIPKIWLFPIFHSTYFARHFDNEAYLLQNYDVQSSFDCICYLVLNFHHCIINRIFIVCLGSIVSASLFFFFFLVVIVSFFLITQYKNIVIKS